jgi:hypothetical protein
LQRRLWLLLLVCDADGCQQRVQLGCRELLHCAAAWGRLLATHCVTERDRLALLLAEALLAEALLVEALCLLLLLVL